jgi:thioredoxin reductase (NADPH)
MSQNHTSKIAILGAGPAGLTAGIYTSRANINTSIYTGFTPGGQLTTTTEIENFPGAWDKNTKEGVLGPDLMLTIQEQAEHFGSKLIYETVQTLSFKQENGKKVFTVTTDDSEQNYDGIIIASGADAKYLGLPNEENWVGKGYHTCATCDGFFYKGKTIAVVGGGDSAMEEANFLTKFAEKVYLINRSNNYRASKIMLERAQNNPKIEFIENEKPVDFIIKEIEGKQKLVGCKLENSVTKDKKDFLVDGIFVAIGHVPNSAFAKGLLTIDEAGYLQKQHLSMSEIEGIFLAGDIQDKYYRQAITAAGDGCRAAIELERWIESLS